MIKYNQNRKHINKSTTDYLVNSKHGPIVQLKTQIGCFNLSNS